MWRLSHDLVGLGAEIQAGIDSQKAKQQAAIDMARRKTS
jgi:hypothetical protein